MEISKVTLPPTGTADIPLPPVPVTKQLVDLVPGDIFLGSGDLEGLFLVIPNREGASLNPDIKRTVVLSERAVQKGFEPILRGATAKVAAIWPSETVPLADANGNPLTAPAPKMRRVLCEDIKRGDVFAVCAEESSGDDQSVFICLNASKDSVTATSLTTLAQGFTNIRDFDNSWDFFLFPDAGLELGDCVSHLSV
jgi:hypothetical protein